MSKENFSPKTMSFLDIIDNSRKYCVPVYQRDYSWDNANDEWDLLWEDIISKDNNHYVGILVLQENGGEINIIDGQQRLTTLTLVILATLYLLHDCATKMTDHDVKANTKQRLEILMSKYIGKKEEDLKYYNKISLNNNNNDFFRSLCDIETNNSCMNIKSPQKELKSNKDLLKALKFFHEKIRNHIFGVTPDKLIEFIKINVADKLLFTTISVSEQENAYMLFETLNSRAVELSAYDLLKNHLLSNIKTDLIDSMLKDLEQINDNIEEDNLTKFIALDWNSKNAPKIMEKRIYRIISRTIKSTRDAFTYVNDLKISSEIYNMIKNASDDSDKETQELLKVMSYIPRITQHYMILLALYRNKDKYGVKSVIKCLLIIAIRYNYICQRQTNKQETIYNSVAQKIQNRSYNHASEIVSELYNSDVYPTDDEVLSEFSKKNFASERIDRYILARLQEFYNGSSPINYDSMTIEHIADKSTKEEYVNLIGNQTILTKIDNNNLSGKPYIEKKAFYATHPNEIVNKISDDQWNRNTVNKRSRELAEIAVKVFSKN